MRKLTIIRRKTFAGSLNTIKVYIEDPESTELKINDVPARKLGAIANGKTKTFEIEETELRVFVIAGKMSKGYCADFVTVPAGIDDVTLSGENYLDPSIGNAFIFDNNSGNAEANAYRSKGRKKVIRMWIIAGIIGFVLGMTMMFGSIILNSSPLEADTTFTAQGYSITLSWRFRKARPNGVIDAYLVNDMSVYATRRDKFSDQPELKDVSITDYGNWVMSLATGTLMSKGLEKKDGLTYLIFETDENDGSDVPCLSYYFIFKTDDSFWVFSFASPTEIALKNEQFIFDAAKSIEFTSAN